MKFRTTAVAAIALVLAGSSFAQQRDHRRDGDGRHDGDHRRGGEIRRDVDRRHDGDRRRAEPRREIFRSKHWRGDIRHFRDHDARRWHSGRWHHGRHGGKDGWWWIVGGTWYYYPAAVYPYPDPYVPPVVTVLPSETPTQYWYYCRNPAGYYPYVPVCRVEWEAVPAVVPQ